MSLTHTPTPLLQLSRAEFGGVRDFMLARTGVSLSEQKQALICGRLARRIADLGLTSVADYLRLLGGADAGEEVQQAINLLTTNETHFFREAQHLDFLRRQLPALQRPGQTLRVWSAACSSGEEPYSLAMVLAETLGLSGWEVLGTDISSQVLRRAVQAVYPLERARQMPAASLQRWCRRGRDEFDGQFLVNRELRERVRFGLLNLNAPLPQLGRFQLIFLRNVMIYFDDATRLAVLNRVLGQLEPGGYLVIGRSESLHGLGLRLEGVEPAIYRKP